MTETPFVEMLVSLDGPTVFRCSEHGDSCVRIETDERIEVECGECSAAMIWSKHEEVVVTTKLIERRLGTIVGSGTLHH